MDDVTAYIEAFQEPVRAKMKAMRALIKSIVPEAQEKISYQMPAYYLNGYLFYFAGFSKHIGFYPTSSGIAAFQDELKARNYKFAKGSVQFPLDQDLPLDLVEKIVRFRVGEQRSLGRG